MEVLQIKRKPKRVKQVKEGRRIWRRRICKKLDEKIVTNLWYKLMCGERHGMQMNVIMNEELYMGSPE